MKIAFLAAAALALSAACPAPPRLPPQPGAFWIWPSLAEARRWEAEHRQRICIHRVPDGWATFGC